MPVLVMPGDDVANVAASPDRQQSSRSLVEILILGAGLLK